MRLTPVRFHFFLVLAGFIRPVVLLGPIADITRDKLLQDMPEVFAIPSKHFCPFHFVAYFKILNFSIVTCLQRFPFIPLIILSFIISAAFGGKLPAGRSPMRSSRRSISYNVIRSVIDSVSSIFCKQRPPFSHFNPFTNM